MEKYGQNGTISWPQVINAIKETDGDQEEIIDNKIAWTQVVEAIKKWRKVKDFKMNAK